MYDIDDALEMLDTYGADISRWPEELEDVYQDYTQDERFQERLTEIEALDSEIARLSNDDEADETVDFGEKDEDDDEDDGESDDEDDDGDFDFGDEDQDDASDGDSSDGEDDSEADADSDSDADPELSDETDDGKEGEEDASTSAGNPNMDDDNDEPMDIDMSDLSDMEEVLAEALEATMKGSFGTTEQVDYSRDFDVINPYPSDSSIKIEPFDEAVRKLTGVMQKEIQRLMVAKSKSYNVGGYRSGRINAPALHRAAAGDDRLFRRKVTATTNAVAVSLVVDISGSMVTNDKIRTAMLSAWAFAQVLDTLKITNEIVGFTTASFDVKTHGRNVNEEVREGVTKMYASTKLPQGSIRWVPAFFAIFKGYNERFTAEPKRRMATIINTKAHMGSNNDAVALQYASERLMQRPEPRKIMIVFSDGQPTDGGTYPSFIGNSMRRTIASIAKRGVETIGIGILDATVTQFYEKNFVIKNVNELPKMVMSQLKKLLV